MVRARTRGNEKFIPPAHTSYQGESPWSTTPRPRFNFLSNYCSLITHCQSPGPAADVSKAQRPQSHTVQHNIDIWSRECTAEISLGPLAVPQQPWPQRRLHWHNNSQASSNAHNFFAAAFVQHTLEHVAMSEVVSKLSANQKKKQRQKRSRLGKRACGQVSCAVHLR